MAPTAPTAAARPVPWVVRCAGRGRPCAPHGDHLTPYASESDLLTKCPEPTKGAARAGPSFSESPRPLCSKPQKRFPMLTFQPKPGMLLICNFTGFQAPEMIKVRPVVVISPRRRSGTRLCTIVPLSTTVPSPVEPFHHRMDPRSLPSRFRVQDSWAKCDMVYTVALDRLDRVRLRIGGRWTYCVPRVLGQDLDSIRRGVLKAFDLT